MNKLFIAVLLITAHAQASDWMVFKDRAVVARVPRRGQVVGPLKIDPTLQHLGFATTQGEAVEYAAPALRLYGTRATSLGAEGTTVIEALSKEGDIVGTMKRNFKFSPLADGKATPHQISSQFEQNLNPNLRQIANINLGDDGRTLTARRDQFFVAGGVADKRPIESIVSTFTVPEGTAGRIVGFHSVVTPTDGISIVVQDGNALTQYLVSPLRSRPLGQIRYRLEPGTGRQLAETEAASYLAYATAAPTLHHEILIGGGARGMHIEEEAFTQ